MTNPIYITLAIDPEKLAIVHQIGDDLAKVQEAWGQMVKNMALLVEVDKDDTLPDPNKWQFKSGA